MRVPVLIAARNEEQYIGQTLASLDAATVEPYVIVNDCSDGTAAEAARYTDKVFIRSEPGKIAAIQYGLALLGPQALQPVLYTDADTQPVFPRHWSKAMVKGLGHEAGVGGGIFIASDGETTSRRLLMSVLRAGNFIEKALQGKVGVGGMNMITYLTEETLAATMELENVWHCEDELRSVAARGGYPPKIILRPAAAVKTSSRYLDDPYKLLKMGRRRTLEQTRQNRIDRTAPGVLSDLSDKVI